MIFEDKKNDIIPNRKYLPTAFCLRRYGVLQLSLLTKRPIKFLKIRQAFCFIFRNTPAALIPINVNNNEIFNIALKFVKSITRINKV